MDHAIRTQILLAHGVALQLKIVVLSKKILIPLNFLM